MREQETAVPRCIVVCVLEEAAAPESEEFEVSAKSTVHRQLVSLCLSPDRL